MPRNAKLQLPDSSEPLHERLAEALEHAISAGAYRPGERLPTHRAIATEAGVAIGTVTRAIDALSRRGIVRGEIGRGTFVRREPVPAPSSDVVDLTINAPIAVIPEEIMAKAMSLAAHRAALLPNGGYADLTGTQGQREIIASWLGRTRLDVDASEVILCTGAQQGLHLAFAEARAHSRSIATESASFSGTISAAQNLGMDLLAVDHDDEGMLPESLDKVLSHGRCRLVYMTPVCQNPLGFETNPERRTALLDICIRHGALIVEDDIYGIYATTGRVTYKSLAPDRVFFVTSLSKCLTPLIRVGLVVPPQHARAAMARRMRAESWGPSPLAIEIGCALIEFGADLTAERALREEAKIRVRLAEEILGIQPAMPEGAPHVWLPMPAIAAERLARRASEHGVRLTPPDATSVSEQVTGGVRLCLMAPASRDDLERALRTIAMLLDENREAVV